MMRGKSSNRLVVIIAVIVVYLAVHVFAPQFVHGATFTGMCSASHGYMVGKQCRWPLRISQTTTRKACRSVGGTFALMAKYQRCSR